MSSNQQVLTITNLNKTFKSNHVLKDLSCTLEQGKVYGLIGKNGAGKTTLIKCIIGALLTDSGKILINNISNQKTKEKPPIAYIPEKILFPMNIILSNF
ncbi:ATP-binding cassette domain-containing protein [Spiroplasma endosymbiont of Nebria brevicollis]|uniref:ATP-binding cassette domain-containing protein n=1 Tax=Spiroplasma endosymbiont of Nebria brevicollis TaxID=3066284 RepID=UPI00313ECC39